MFCTFSCRYIALFSALKFKRKLLLMENKLAVWSQISMTGAIHYSRLIRAVLHVMTLNETYFTGSILKPDGRKTYRFTSTLSCVETVSIRPLPVLIDELQLVSWLARWQYSRRVNVNSRYTSMSTCYESEWVTKLISQGRSGPMGLFHWINFYRHECQVCQCSTLLLYIRL